MPCEFSQTHLHAYLDGELDAPTAAQFERHLETCPDCAALLTSEQTLRQAVLSSSLYEPAPDRLRQKISSALPQTRPARAISPQGWRWLALAASILLVLVAGGEIFSILRNPSAPPAAAVAAVDAHLRSLQPSHLTDVLSSDQHTVKPWFAGKVDFAPTVRDFAAGGYPLLGGRLDVISGRTVPALAYGRARHIVSVFIDRPQAGLALSGSGEIQGYRWLAWQGGGFTYIAVSDTAAVDLRTLRDLLSKEQ